MASYTIFGATAPPRTVQALVIPRRGSLPEATKGTVSGTQRPAAPPTDYHEEGRPGGGQTGAHEQRSEHGADVLKVHCWCQRKIVKAPTAVVRRAETLSCGQPECTKGNY